MNLGASLGVALIGSILIASLVGGFQKAVLADPALAAVAPELTAQAEQSANFVSVEQVALAAEQAGLTPEEVAAVTAQYADAQIMALKVAFAALAFFSLLALWYVQSLPKRADGESPADAAWRAEGLAEHRWIVKVPPIPGKCFIAVRALWVWSANTVQRSNLLSDDQ